MLPIFTRYLSPKDYGAIATITFFTLILSTIFTFGLNTSIGICYFDKQYLHKKNLVIWNSFLVLFISSLVMLLLGVIFLKPLSSAIFHSGNYSSFIIMGILITFFTLLVYPFQFRLQFEEKQLLFITLLICSTTFTIGINFFLVAILRAGVFGMLLGMTLGGGFSTLLYGASFLKDIEMKLEPEIMKKLIRYGLPMMPSFFFLYVLQQGNIFILQRFNSLQAAGLYSVGYNLGMGMLIVISAFSTAWGPFFLSFVNRKKEAEVLFGRITTYYIFGVGMLSLLFYIFAKPIVLFLNPTFLDAYKVIGLTATAQYLFGIFYLLLPPIYFAKEVHRITITQIIAALLYMVTAYFFITYFSLIGAGISLVIGYFIMSFLLFLWNKIRQKKYLRIRYEWKRVIPFCLYYTLIVIIFLNIMQLSLITEIIIQIMALISLVFVVFLSLDKSEKIYLYNKLILLKPRKKCSYIL